MNLKDLKLGENPEKKYWAATQGQNLNIQVAGLLTKTKRKLYQDLSNATSKTIPLDILFHTKRRKLFQIVVNEVESMVLEKVTLEVTPREIYQKKTTMISELLKRSEKKFFLECDPFHLSNLFSNAQLINYDNSITYNLENFLELILLFCLFGSSNKTKVIFNPIFGDKIPAIQVEVLFENFIIEISNYFIDALLRSSSGIVFGFQNYLFDDKYYSIRKVEQFRNNLMWYKFTNRYINIPKNIYENRYNIWIMGPKGIISKNIFGHRLYELSDLSTTQLVITFILEIQDFLLPKLYTLVQVLMKAIFYIISGPIKSKIRIIWKSISSDFS